MGGIERPHGQHCAMFLNMTWGCWVMCCSSVREMRDERLEARPPSVPVFTSLKPLVPSLSCLFPPLPAVLVPSPVHARFLKRHPVGFGVVPEGTVHVLVAVARQQHNLQGIAGLDAVAVLGRPAPAFAARLAVAAGRGLCAACACGPMGVAVQV